MHLYQRSYTSTTGETKRAKTWWLVAYVGGERIHVTTGARDKRAAELIASDIVRKAELKRAGIVDPFEDQQARTLDDHVKDFLSTVRARGVVEKYLKDREKCLRAYIGHRGAKRLKDLDLASASAWLNELRGETGLSHRSINTRYAALKQFGAWLVASRRSAHDPFSGLRALNEAEDQRHVRRALTPEEAQRLVEAARSRPLHQAKAGRTRAGVSDREHERLTRLGETRALIYLIALGTGLRMGEIRRLRWCDLEGGQATIPAASAKSRRDQSVPLPARLAAALSAYRPRTVVATVSVIPAGAFPNTRTFDHDLAAAGIAKRDEEERIVDRHALRTTYISWLAATGAHPRTAQALARHADVETTMQRYTDLRLLDSQAAVEKLPLPDGVKGKRRAAAMRTWARRGTAQGA